jgi:pheromone shutdown protein TraB
MPLSPHLQRKLQESLGQEAAEDLVSFMEKADAHRADVAELRHEMQLGFTRLESRMEAMLEKRFSELLKWSFVFWVGAVTAVAALAGVLR